MNITNDTLMRTTYWSPVILGDTDSIAQSSFSTFLLIYISISRKDIGDDIWQRNNITSFQMGMISINLVIFINISKY